MIKPNPNMVLVETERYGGKDHKAINKHVQRIYLVQGIAFCVDKVLDAYPQSYELWQVARGHYSNIIPYDIPVEGKTIWGDGLSWPQAEKLAYTAILAYIADKGLTK